VLSEPRQELRLHLSVRRALIEARAQYTTTVRGLLRAHGHRPGGCHPMSFVRLVREMSLDAATRALVEPLLAVLEVLNTQIVACDAKLEVLAAREPAIAKLKTAPGVGTVVAAAFVSVIDDPYRFDRAHAMESYLGLVPSEHTSGKRRLGAISKQGNSYLRALFVQSAWGILRMKEPDPMREWGRAVMDRRGARVAIIAVARRLAGVLWAMWRDDTVYEPARLGADSAAGLKLQAQSVALQAALVARAARKRIYSSCIKSPTA
jgi:transposase